MVLVGPHEHHRLMLPQVLGEARVGLLAEQVRQHRGQLLAGSRRQRDADDLLQLVDRAGGAAADADDAAVRAGVDRLLDGAFGLLQQVRHRTAADVVLGMRVGVDALKVLDVALDQAEAAAGGGVIGIHHQAVAERRGHRGIGADHLVAQEWRSPVCMFVSLIGFITLFIRLTCKIRMLAATYCNCLCRSAAVCVSSRSAVFAIDWQPSPTPLL